MNRRFGILAAMLPFIGMGGKVEQPTEKATKELVIRQHNSGVARRKKNKEFRQAGVRVLNQRQRRLQERRNPSLRKQRK